MDTILQNIYTQLQIKACRKDFWQEVIGYLQWKSGHINPGAVLEIDGA
jgi:hypothetical protein